MAFKNAIDIEIHTINYLLNDKSRTKIILNKDSPFFKK